VKQPARRLRLVRGEVRRRMALLVGATCLAFEQREPLLRPAARAVGQLERIGERPVFFVKRIRRPGDRADIFRRGGDLFLGRRRVLEAIAREDVGDRSFRLIDGKREGVKYGGLSRIARHVGAR
jgi:hypothetical protein